MFLIFIYELTLKYHINIYYEYTLIFQVCLRLKIYEKTLS